MNLENEQVDYFVMLKNKVNLRKVIEVKIGEKVNFMQGKGLLKRVHISIVQGDRFLVKGMLNFVYEVVNLVNEIAHFLLVII